MRLRLRSQSKKKLKEKSTQKNIKEQKQKKSPQKSSNDDQNTKTITNVFSLKKQLTQNKQQQKKKSKTKQQQKSNKKKNQKQSAPKSNKKKNPSQLSYSKQKKKLQSKEMQRHQDRSEKSRQDDDSMLDIQDIIGRELGMHKNQYKKGRKSYQQQKEIQYSFRPKPSHQQIVKAIFFPEKHKSIQNKSISQKMIMQGILRVDRDLMRKKWKNKNNNSKKVTRKASIKVERLKDKVDKEILNGGVVPWLLPEWGLEKVWKNKDKEVREWMRSGIGFEGVEQENEGSRERQQSRDSQSQQQRQQQQQHKRYQQNSNNEEQHSHANPNRNNLQQHPQQQSIYYQRAIINENFQKYYKTGMQFLYQHLPKRSIRLHEFQSYDDFVKSNFTIVYYLSRFYYKNFDQTKRYFTTSAQFDKYYTQDLMDCFQYIFPEVKDIVENQWKEKFQKGWDEYDQHVGVRAYEQRRQEKMRKDRNRMRESGRNQEQQMDEQQEQDKITYIDWLNIFKKAFTSTDKQKVINNNQSNHQRSNQQQEQKQQQQNLLPKSQQQLQVQQQQQIEMVESNNFIACNINEGNFESPMRKNIQNRKFMQNQQQQLQQKHQDTGQVDLDEYYHQISTIIKSKRKEEYSSLNHDTTSAQKSQQSTNRIGAWYQQHQSVKKQQVIKQEQLQKIERPKKKKHKKTNKRLNKSMIELRQKVNLDSDSEEDTEEEIQGLDEAFHYEDEQDY